jgi:hypothetical protein
MKPVKQTLFYDKDGVGNCFEACLSSILEIEISTIPMFHDKDWFPRLWEWLLSKGYMYHGLLKPDQVASYNIGVDGYFIVAGESPRGQHIKGGHAVVYKNGIMVHDPHPDNRGIINIKYGIMIESEISFNLECTDCLNLDPSDCDPEEVGHYCGCFKKALPDYPVRPSYCISEGSGGFEKAGSVMKLCPSPSCSGGVLLDGTTCPKCNGTNLNPNYK